MNKQRSSFEWHQSISPLSTLWHKHTQNNILITLSSGEVQDGGAGVDVIPDDGDHGTMLATPEQTLLWEQQRRDRTGGAGADCSSDNGAGAVLANTDTMTAPQTDHDHKRGSTSITNVDMGNRRSKY